MHLLLLQRKFRPFLMKIPLIMKSLLRERYLVSILIWIFNLFMKSNSCTRDCNHVSYQAYWQTCHQLNCTNNNHCPGVNPGSEIFTGDCSLHIIGKLNRSPFCFFPTFPRTKFTSANTAHQNKTRRDSDLQRRRSKLSKPLYFLLCPASCKSW